MARWLLIAAFLLVTGCGSPPPANPLHAAMIEPGPGAMSRLTGADHGIELHKWLIADVPDTIADGVRTHADRVALPDETRGHWERNGFRLVRAPLAELPDLLSDLGGAAVNLKGWHGQIATWQPVHELSLGDAPATLAIDGRVRRFRGGRLVMLARGWTVPMETGPYLHLELCPAYTPPAGNGELLDLLQRPAPGTTPHPFEAMSAEVPLEIGFAYLLTCERPGLEWVVGAPDPVAPGALDPAGAGPAETRTQTRAGPGAVAPPTLGQMMLASQAGPPTRGVLVFVPRIPPALFPPVENPSAGL